MHGSEQSIGQVAIHENEEKRSIKHDNEQKKAYNWTGVNKTENGQWTCVNKTENGQWTGVNRTEKK